MCDAMTRIGVAAATALTAWILGALPVAAASADTFCAAELGGTWNGRSCQASVHSERNAVRDITVAVPVEFIDDAAAGPVVRDYLRTLVEHWRSVGEKMVADSFGEGTYQIFRHGPASTLVYRETYHADGPDFNNAYRTFTFADGRALQLADLMKPGVDPLTAIPPLAEPFVIQALNAAMPPHRSGSYPFVPDRWTPDKVYSGGYRAWALTPDELVLYLPDYPVGRDSPTNYTPGVMQWSMDGGTVQVHLPLAALAPLLRREFGGT